MGEGSGGGGAKVWDVVISAGIRGRFERCESRALLYMAASCSPKTSRKDEMSPEPPRNSAVWVARSLGNLNTGCVQAGFG